MDVARIGGANLSVNVATWLSIGMLAFGAAVLADGRAYAGAPITSAREAIARAPHECFGAIPPNAHWYVKRERVNWAPPEVFTRVGHSFRFWHYEAWIVWFDGDQKGPACDARSAVLRRANGQLLYCVHTNCAERGPPPEFPN